MIISVLSPSFLLLVTLLLSSELSLEKDFYQTYIYNKCQLVCLNYLHIQREKHCPLKLYVSIHTEHYRISPLVHIVYVVHTISDWQVLTGEMANLE